jgi:chromosome segregation ATPase
MKIRNILGLAEKLPEPQSAVDRLRHYRATAMQALGAEVAALNARITEGERTVRQPLLKKRAQLTALQAQRAAAWAAGTGEEALAQQIQQCEAELRDLEDKAKYVVPAIDALAIDMRAKQAEMLSLQQNARTLELAAVEELLSEEAQEYSAAVAAYRQALTKVAALCAARDALTANMRGIDSVVGSGMFYCDLPPLVHPAFSKIPANLNVHAEAQDRKTEVLRELGIRL